MSSHHVPKEELKEATSSVPMRFVCKNTPRTYIIGHLVLPTEFVGECGDKIPRDVWLHMPSGAVWEGVYINSHKWIEGLSKFMITYGVRPYYMLSMEYVGGGHFNVTVFNPTAVEINYEVTYSDEELEGMAKGFFSFPDLEIDSLCTIIGCNGYTNGNAASEVVISSSHLKKKRYYKMFEIDEILNLGIDDNFQWLEIGFKYFSWLVKLKWKYGYVYFDKEWYKFAKAAELKVGDICSFVRTNYPKRFEISVLQKDYLAECNIKGIGKMTGVMSWFKYLDDLLCVNGHLEIPRVFVEQYGFLLKNVVTLVLPDKRTFALPYCSELHLIYGVEQLVQTYSMKVNDIMIFTYVPESTFEVSVYKGNGMDSFKTNWNFINSNKVTNEAVLTKNDESSSLRNAIVTTDSAVILRKSHVDNRGHGVFLPRELLPIYKVWKNLTTIRLICEGEEFEMKVWRSQNMCRLAKGWTQFTVKKQLKEGDKLSFVYQNKRALVVTVEPQ